MNSTQKQHSVLVVAAAMQLFSACSPMSPNLDSKFGDSVTALKAQQTFDAAASTNTALTTQDGHAAQESTERYYKSYATPKPVQHVLNIGVSGR